LVELELTIDTIELAAELVLLSVLLATLASEEV
jgi:hypothetical protein